MEAASSFVLRSIDTLVEVVRAASGVLVCCQAETRQHNDTANAAHGSTIFTITAIVWLEPGLLLVLVPELPIMLR